MICTLQQYRSFTADYVSFDGDVTAALAEAQTVIEERTERSFERATRTETLRVWPDGRVYPVSYPLVSISAPANAVIEGPAIRITGYLYPEWVKPLWGVQQPIMQDVTYTGGFATIPLDLQRLGAQIAQLVLAPSLPIGSATPAATTDLEGYSSPPLAVLTEWPPSVVRQFRRWKHIKTKLNMHYSSY